MNERFSALAERTKLNKLGQLSRKTYQITSFCLIAVVLIESVALFAALHRSTTSSAATQQLSNVPLPANSDLARIETIPSDHLQVWYYTITNSSVDGILSFYTFQAHQQNWTCFTTMKLISNQRNGQPITGIGVQIAFKQGTTHFTIVSGDQEYGNIVLGDVLDAGSIALRISVEPPPGKGC